MATTDGAFGFIVRDESLLALAVYAGTDETDERLLKDPHPVYRSVVATS